MIFNKWNTIFDLDFTQTIAQTFTSDGTYTISNNLWTKGNSANEITHAAITSSGLNFQPSSGTDYYGGSTRTIPYMWLPFSQIFPASIFPFGWNTRLRFYVSIGTDNIATSYDNEVFGFDNNAQALYAICKRGIGTSGAGMQIVISVNGNNTNGYNTDSFTLGSANKTYIIETTPQIHKVNVYRTSGLSAGSAFPLLSTFLPAQITFNGGLNATGSGFGNLATSGLTNPGLMGIILGAQRAGSGTSLSINFQRIRLDAQFDD